MPACQRGPPTNVLACQRGLRANVPACQRANGGSLRATMLIKVPKCHTACQCFNVAYQRAKRRAVFSTWRANVPKGVPVFQTFHLRNVKGNFYTLLYKKLYIILHIIVIHMICICIVHKNCIILHVMLKKSVRNFYFFIIFSRIENIKRSRFYPLQETRVFSNCSQLKQRNKIKNMCEYCDLLEL